MRKSRYLLIGALAGALVLVAAVPALAGNLSGTVNNKGPAGDGYLRHNGGGSYTLIACDIKKDGASTVAYAWSDKSGTPVSARDANGANKSRSITKACDTHHIGLSGSRVYLQVCRQDRDGDVDENKREVCAPIKTTSN